MNHIDFFKRFPTENDAIDFIVETKFKNGYVCPKCRCVHHKIFHQKYNHRYLYCNNCKSEFSALTGTIFEHTHLDLRMCLDNDMNPIEKEPEYRNAGKECFGVTKVINQDGKYNFIDTNGNLFSETWFDVANDFTKTKNGVIHAYVIVDEVDGFLDKKEMKFIPNQ